MNVTGPSTVSSTSSFLTVVLAVVPGTGRA
jgi:hypothetical protein